MWLKVAAASTRIVLGMALLVPPSRGYAENAPTPRPGTWPIQNWHQLQPREDQLKAMHMDDLTPEDARKVEQLYWELEGQSTNGAVKCDARSIPPRERNQCRAAAGASVMPSRPVPIIMAPSRPRLQSIGR